MVFRQFLTSILLSCFMVVKDDLSVVWREDFETFDTLLVVLLELRIHVDHFSITLVSEKQTALTASGIDFEVRGIVGSADACLPVVVAEVTWLRHEFHTPIEDWSEVFRFESMCVIDVAAHLCLFCWVFNPKEDDR